MLFFVTITILSFVTSIQAQDHKESWSFGFSYGMGKQEVFPFNNKNYAYHIHYYKVHLGYPIANFKNFTFEVIIEPGIYRAKHQLLNKWFVQPDRWDNYLELREKYVQKRRYNEYVLNLGAILRYTFTKRLSIYLVGCTGPAYSNEETERLAKGFAFSSSFGIGIAYVYKKVTLEIRPSLRHLSNANMQFPNIGHNSTNLECGFRIWL